MALLNHLLVFHGVFEIVNSYFYLCYLQVLLSVCLKWKGFSEVTWLAKFQVFSKQLPSNLGLPYQSLKRSSSTWLSVVWRFCLDCCGCLLYFAVPSFFEILSTSFLLLIREGSVEWGLISLFQEYSSSSLFFLIDERLIFLCKRQIFIKFCDDFVAV